MGMLSIARCRCIRLSGFGLGLRVAGACVHAHQSACLIGTQLGEEVVLHLQYGSALVSAPASAPALAGTLDSPDQVSSLEIYSILLLLP